MLVEVICNDDNSLVLEVLDDVSALLPFKSVLMKWKEEVYFSTPYSAKLESLSASAQAIPGKVYYWPPEKAFCIFYGFSEPYSEIYLIGSYVGPLSRVRMIPPGEIKVVNHIIDGELLEISNIFSKLGYLVATPLEGGKRVSVASKHIGDVRVAFTAIKEDFGMYIESDSFYYFINSFEGVRTTFKFKNKLKAMATTARFDLNEDGYTCLTAIVRNLKDLEVVVKELERAYQYVYRELTYTP
ncbi:MAG: cyclophilin-like family protein [Sulfolobales archaeon]|nr:hypothetical protein [Sulfolobales archaeon]MCX8186048.1 hypothetical protein [Sulfolobales archaeon]MDW7969343.1 cyclophilin-like family protein [Sulfolobales archaeon]